MTEETSSNETSSEESISTETTSENLETQQSEESQDSTQPDKQEDTKEEDASIGDDLSIEEKSEEPEESESKQLSLDDLVEEALSGEYSEEAKKMIEENGLSKHLEMLVAGHKAVQEKNNNEVFDVVGGKESYTELQEWGKHNISKDEQGAFNEALFSGNMHLAKLAVQGLQAQYIKANGKSPDRVIEGGGSSNEDNRPFKSVNEYIDITRTQKYKRDPEFKASIEAKRNLSGF